MSIREIVVQAEDDDDHAELLELAWEDLSPDAELVRVRDGASLLDYLTHLDPNRERPILILLDLKMPGMNGFDVLQALKGGVETRRIPVVVLSSSSADRDVKRAYDEHANGYVIKAGNQHDFVKVLMRFWGRFNVLAF